MEILLPENIKGFKSYVVQDEDTALSIGSGDVMVLATPKLLALMEEVSYKSVAKYLPKGFVSVGVQMNIKHLKSSKVGQRIDIESQLIKQEGKKIYFSVVATSQDGQKIGEGLCDRVIVDKEKFESK